MCYFVYSPVCYDVRLSHLNKDYLLTYLLTYILIRRKGSVLYVCTSDGRNQIAIRFNRDLNRNEDSIQTLRDSIQVPCDLILIRFKF